MAGKPETRKEEVRKLMEEIEQERRRKREIAGKREAIMNAVNDLPHLFNVAFAAFILGGLLTLITFFTGQLVLGVLNLLMTMFAFILMDRIEVTHDKMFPIQLGEFMLTERKRGD